MSHMSSYKTDIKLDNALANGRSVEEDPGWDILSEAIFAAAEDLNLDISHTIHDYYGRAILCDWALTSPDMPRGLGVNVDRKTGEVSFISDNFGGYERYAEEIKDRIVQNYSALCVTKALAALNYSVDVDEVKHPIEGKKVLVRGVL
jgi:hypothetical protein